MQIAHWVILALSVVVVGQAAVVTWALRRAEEFGRECIAAQDVAIKRGDMLLALMKLL